MAAEKRAADEEAARLAAENQAAEDAVRAAEAAAAAGEASLSAPAAALSWRGALAPCCLDSSTPQADSPAATAHC